ncbi:hypothetical protein B0T17DRAFT_462900, partial [Bombardia bombarda]
MIFSDLYKSPRSPLNKLRSHPHPLTVVPDLDTDLVSKDKARQKEAVRRYLAEKVRNDWEFVWPPASPSPPASVGEEQEQQQQLSHIPPPLDTNPTPPAPQPPAQHAAQNDVLPGADATSDGDTFPPRDPGEEADSESDAESVYSTVSDDPANFRPRAEWISDLSDDDRPPPPQSTTSPFRFDSPAAVGNAVRSSVLTKKALRRKAVRDEVTWNPGVACFVARRDAWTGAKTVRVKPKTPSPTSSSSSRRLSFFRHKRPESAPAALSPTATGASSGSPPSAVSSPLSPTTTATSQHSNASATTPPASEPNSSSSSHPASPAKVSTEIALQSTSSRESATPQNNILYPVQTLLPLAAPLLPPQNPMRASVTPSVYPSLYDKIVVHSLQPSCPVNLGDMLRACVVGWKRDGEWPPKPAAAAFVAMPPQAPTAAELAALRHRKAVAAQQQQQQQQHARKGSTATVGGGSGRRMSFGFLVGGGGGGGGGGKGGMSEENKENQNTHSDESGGGKGIRRSLQKVFSLGHGGHG